MHCKELENLVISQDLWALRNSKNCQIVEMALNDTVSLGASGGGGKTATEADAISQDAYVKIRPIRGRSQDVIAIVDPFLLLND